MYYCYYYFYYNNLVTNRLSFYKLVLDQVVTIGVVDCVGTYVCPIDELYRT